MILAPEAVTSPFVAWESFYVIVGSSSAALTGLMFVVVSLIPSTRIRGTQETIDAFSTPTIVHFCIAFLVSAVLSAPWRSPANAGLVLTLAGIFGLAYTIIVIRRAQRQVQYTAVLEDVLWHFLFPLIAYATIVVAGARVAATEDRGLFGVAGAVLGLLFIGVHNAWDTVAYIATLPKPSQRDDE